MKFCARMWIALIAIISALTTPAGAQELTTGKWLVDLGRDYPLSAQAGLSETDGQIALLFMEAARRIEPELAEACHWSYDLLSALGREPEALENLGHYVALQPDDQPAYLDWVDLNLRNQQIAEQRVEFCREQLERKQQPAEVLSHLHRRLAELYFNRGDLGPAEQEAAAAVEAYPCNISAVTLLEQLRAKPTGPAAHVQYLLRVLACNPADIESTRRLADLLCWEGLSEEADRWYRHAVSLHERIPPYTAPPELRLARASALLDADRIEPAEQILRQINESHPDRIDGQLLNARLAEKHGDPATARRYIETASDKIKFLLANAGPSTPLDPDLVADMAWFFAHYDPQPAEAEKLARSALADRPDSPVAKRALGSALRQTERIDEAVKLLEPLADTDMWAAIELARSLEKKARSDEARTLLTRLTTQPANGEQWAALAALGGPASASVPASRPAAADIRAALDGFDHAVLEYPLDTSKYLFVTIRPAEPEFLPGRPWWCDFEIKNRGPFAITLGPVLMTDAELLCTVETTGDRRRTSGATLRVSLNRKVRLAPGESVSLRQTLDIGTIRAGMIGTPQMDHQVSVSAILAPVMTSDPQGQPAWRAGPGGLEFGPVRFRRRALGVNRQTLDKIIGAARSGAIPDRIRAAELLAMLLAEQQHLAAGRLNYHATRLDIGNLQSAVLDRLGDPDWSVRARVAEALRWFVLDSAGTQRAMGLLSDEHWLVRGVALRMLTDHYADKFGPVLQRHADSDPDPWVRRLAAALRERTLNKTAATQPE